MCSFGLDYVLQCYQKSLLNYLGEFTDLVLDVQDRALLIPQGSFSIRMSLIIYVGKINKNSFKIQFLSLVLFLMILFSLWPPKYLNVTLELIGRVYRLHGCFDSFCLCLDSSYQVSRSKWLIHQNFIWLIFLVMIFSW